MTPDQIFSIVNLLAALWWILLPVRRATVGHRLVTGLILPAIFAAL